MSGLSERPQLGGEVPTLFPDYRGSDLVSR